MSISKFKENFDSKKAAWRKAASFALAAATLATSVPVINRADAAPMDNSYSSIEQTMNPRSKGTDFIGRYITMSHPDHGDAQVQKPIEEGINKSANENAGIGGDRHYSIASYDGGKRIDVRQSGLTKEGIIHIEQVGSPQNFIELSPGKDPNIIDVRFSDALDNDFNTRASFTNLAGTFALENGQSAHIPERTAVRGYAVPVDVGMITGKLGQSVPMVPADAANLADAHPEAKILMNYDSASEARNFTAGSSFHEDKLSSPNEDAFVSRSAGVLDANNKNGAIVFHSTAFHYRNDGPSAVLQSSPDKSHYVLTFTNTTPDDTAFMKDVGLKSAKKAFEDGTGVVVDAEHQHHFQYVDASNVKGGHDKQYIAVPSSVINTMENFGGTGNLKVLTTDEAAKLGIEHKTPIQAAEEQSRDSGVARIANLNKAALQAIDKIADVESGNQPAPTFQ